MEQKTKRAAIYCRISKTDPNIPKVEDQQLSCRRLAKQAGYDVVAVFTDDGISASKFAVRPQWSALLEAAEAQDFDVIVAVAEDRLTRQPQEKMLAATVCAQAGIIWHTIADGVVDPASDEGELFGYFRAWTARKETRDKSRRQVTANAHRRAEGKPSHGMRPFGYNTDRMTLREDEAMVLKQATATFIETQSVHRALQVFKDSGLPTTQGNAWAKNSVRAALKRWMNAGIVAHKDEPVLNDDGTVVRGQWPAIVSEDDIRTARAILADPRRKTTRDFAPKWLCAGIATCVCGAKMRSGGCGSRGVRIPTLLCRGRIDGLNPGMKHTSIRPAIIDARVREAVLRYHLVAPLQANPVYDADNSALAGLYATLSNISARIGELAAALATGTFTASEVAAPMAALRTEEAGVRSKIEARERSSVHAAMTSSLRRALYAERRFSLDDAVKVKRELGERYDALPLEDKRRLIESLFTITVLPGQRPDRVVIKAIDGTPLWDDEPDDWVSVP